MPDATSGVYYARIRVADAHGVVDCTHMDEGDLRGASIGAKIRVLADRTAALLTAPD